MPLTVAAEGWALNLGEAGAAWKIFANLVRSARGFVDEHGRDILRKDAGDVIDERCRELVPWDVVLDVAGVITRKAGVDTTPFFTPASLMSERIRYRALHADNAQTSSVSESASS
jgi:hypothetical protein